MKKQPRKIEQPEGLIGFFGHVYGPDIHDPDDLNRLTG